MQLAGKKAQFYLDEGVAAVIDAGRGDGGTLFVQSATVPQSPSRAQNSDGRRTADGGPQAAAAPAQGTAAPPSPQNPSTAVQPAAQNPQNPNAAGPGRNTAAVNGPG